MYLQFVIILLSVLPATPYEFVCVYGTCTISNIDLTIDGLYAFSFITNDTDTLILRSATGKRVDFTFLQSLKVLSLIVLVDCKFEEIIIHQLKAPGSLVARHVTLRQILFHPTDTTLQDIRLSGVPFKVIPQSVLQLQQLAELEQCRSPMRHLQLAALRNLHSLVTLNLSYNRIQTVTIDASGECCGKLKSLNLVGNLLVRFNFGVLSYLQQLECVFLGHNHITAISTLVNHNSTSNQLFCSWKNYYLESGKDNDTIAKPPCNDYFAKLNTITLNHNRLTKIDLSTFERMNGLTDLDLAFNNIKTIKVVKDRVPISLNISLLKGGNGYLHDLPPNVFSSLK